MERKSIDFIKDTNEKELIQHIFENAYGNPIEFSGVPTLDDLKSNSWGFYGNDIYIKTSSGAGIKLAGGAFT